MKDMANLYVVYGGTTKCQLSLYHCLIMLMDYTVPEINRIMQKGTTNIIRPDWINECIRTQTLVPFQIKLAMSNLLTIVPNPS